MVILCIGECLNFNISMETYRWWVCGCLYNSNKIVIVGNHLARKNTNLKIGIFLRNGADTIVYVSE